jgi:hypothetical protein
MEISSQDSSQYHRCLQQTRFCSNIYQMLLLLLRVIVDIRLLRGLHHRLFLVTMLL